MLNGAPGRRSFRGAYRDPLLYGLLALCLLGLTAADRVPISAEMQFKNARISVRPSVRPVDIFVASRPDVPLRRAHLIVRGARQAIVEFPAPAGMSRPYVFVRAQDGEGIWTASRAVGLTGAPNFRDIGGYATVDGRHVRWNRVYRSNELSKLTPADLRAADQIGLVAVVDLRTARERLDEPSRWKRRPAYVYESPKKALGSNIASTLAATTPSAARARVIAFYRSMPDLYRDEYRVLFERLARGEGPVLVHCTAGKDRTGLASALILSALRVPRATILSDYALTNVLLRDSTPTVVLSTPFGEAAGFSKGLNRLSPAIQRVLWHADPQYLEAALSSIDAKYGSVEGYLHRALGLAPKQIDAIRSSLLD